MHNVRSKCLLISQILKTPKLLKYSKYLVYNTYFHIYVGSQAKKNGRVKKIRKRIALLSENNLP